MALGLITFVAYSDYSKSTSIVEKIIALFLPARKNNKTKMNSANAVETVSFLLTISGYTSF